MSSTNGVFRVRLRVQCAGVISLLMVPFLIATVVGLLVAVSVALALVVLLAFLVAGQVALVKRWTGIKLKPVSAAEAPELVGLVERLCVESGLSQPKIILHPARYANSWVKGLSSRRSTLHVTQGLVDRLSQSQLEGVVAHELSHIGQKDSPLMSAVGAPVEAMLAGAALYFHSVAALVKAYARSSRSRRDDTPTDTDVVAMGYGFLPLFLLPIGLGFLILGEVCRMVVSWFSRVRELEADAGAARLTGNPSGLASALIALSGSEQRIPLEDLRQASALDIFHIVPMRAEPPLVHTHPSLKRRLAQLEEMERRLQQQRPLRSQS